MSVSNAVKIGSSHWSTFAQIASSSVAKYSKIILGISAAAVTGLLLYRFSPSSSSAAPVNGTDQKDKFAAIKSKVCRTYGYVFGGFALTAVAAVATYVSGLSLSILKNAQLTMPLLGITSLIPLAATILIDKENNKAKHVAWGIFNTLMGMQLSVLGFINQKIVAQAAIISLGLGGALTLSAFLAPDERFLSWEGPLLTTLTGISVASFVAYFFPSTAFAYAVDRVSLYGGLLIFSGLLMCSTQRLKKEATKDDKGFDPIKSSMSIYLDGLNIFIRVLQILLENRKEENS